MNPYLQRRKKDGPGASGVKSERKTAKRIGGQQTKFSGAMPNARGDISLPEFLVEAKSTKLITMRLELTWLVKILREAMKENKEPAVTLTFTTANGDPLVGGTWVLVPESVFRKIS